jgi:hypothetical protein
MSGVHRVRATNDPTRRRALEVGGLECTEAELDEDMYTLTAQVSSFARATSASHKGCGRRMRAIETHVHA